MLLLLRYLLIKRLSVLHQHFHPFRKDGITVSPEFGIVPDFLNRHSGIFQAFDKFHPCEVFIRIAAVVARISFWCNQAFVFIIAQGMDTQLRLF